jgi:transcriptional regulator with XRE-family HTH domain/anti-sigma regulatory factor (Ser/Thr protein kinase)
MAAENVVSLAERLKLRREQLGLSQAQAARELDVARTAYRLWEMEAAKPSPDRWRLISRWLGISVTTMLLAEELISDEEAIAGDITSADFGRRTGRDWDRSAAAEPGTFFEQARQLVSEASAAGYVTDDQAGELETVLSRIEQTQTGASTEAWELTELRMTLRPDEFAPRKARRALEATATGVPTRVVEDAALMTNELVTNSAQHGAKDLVGIELFLQAGGQRLRVEVSEVAGETVPQLRDPSDGGGYGLTFVDKMASRWGTEESDGVRYTWFEMDVATPGA